MKKLLTTGLISISMLANAQKTILLNNVQIFNGKDEKTIKGNVLIVDNLISKISTLPIPTNKSGETKTIDGKGMFLMPGLVDNHVHLAMNTAAQDVLLTLSVDSIESLTRIEGGKMLMRGFTTIRDLGGPVFTAKKEFDKGSFAGPRIFPSGAMISQTSGHGDARRCIKS